MSPMQAMQKEAVCSVVIPVFNEEKTIAQALIHLSQQRRASTDLLLEKCLFEIIVVDNNSTDQTISKVKQFISEHPEMTIIVISESRQGVAWTRKTGIELAVARSKTRDQSYQLMDRLFYIFSSDADCYVDQYWIDEQLKMLSSSQAALSVCHYYYPMDHFSDRPNLAKVINLILKARDITMRIFGGFPDGKGFAVLREKYEKINGIEIFYQLTQGKFVCHLSDDWDFGIKIRAIGEEIVYCPNAKVHTNPRRVDHALNEMIQGIAYGQNGIITMRDIRPNKEITQSDLSLSEAKLLFDYSIKDFTTKHIILPILLTPAFLKQKAVIDFLSPALCEKLAQRISEITEQMRMKDFTPIHTYKTPCFRLYFKFKDILFERMRLSIDPEIGMPPVLPNCLEQVLKKQPECYQDYVYYYCEDRESGEAHNYFGNGGVF